MGALLFFLGMLDLRGAKYDLKKFRSQATHVRVYSHHAESQGVPIAIFIFDPHGRLNGIDGPERWGFRRT